MLIDIPGLFTRAQINRAIDVWNAGGGLVPSLAKAIMAFEDRHRFLDFTWRFDPVIREQLLDALEESARDEAAYMERMAAERRVARLEAERIASEAAEAREEARRRREADYVPPVSRPRFPHSPERTARIIELRNSGMTLRAVGEAVGVNHERVRQILAQHEREQSRRTAIAQREASRLRWLRDHAGGHPDIVDQYGVEIVATPRDIYLDDRMLMGRDIG